MLQKGQGLSKKGKDFFVGAANREAALSTAEKSYGRKKREKMMKRSRLRKKKQQKN